MGFSQRYSLTLVDTEYEFYQKCIPFYKICLWRVGDAQFQFAVCEPGTEAKVIQRLQFIYFSFVKVTKLKYALLTVPFLPATAIA